MAENYTNIIIPMCGTASRIGGIPKFLLPITNDKSLLLLLLEKLNINGNNIFISTVPMYAEYIYNYTIKYRPHINISKTETMSETVNKYNYLKNDTKSVNIMVMPDTYISDNIPIKEINSLINNNADIILCVWKISEIQRGKLGQCLLDENNNVIHVEDKNKNCKYEYAWGIMCWNYKYWDYIDDKKSHIGLSLNDAIKNKLKIKAIIMNGTYNDCGTIDEYKKVLNTTEQ